ncbi:unnamed protein product [Owenia fusiformis]|uniref:Uncharacterized protein n=1 Tax=Owenia fusiformis TaxID=6347 RepID=A0A8J1TTR5_OWEFU|nr:unnamed protein product [Owenia fusiformis]
MFWLICISHILVLGLAIESYEATDGGMERTNQSIPDSVMSILPAVEAILKDYTEIRKILDRDYKESVVKQRFKLVALMAKFIKEKSFLLASQEKDSVVKKNIWNLRSIIVKQLLPVANKLSKSKKGRRQYLVKLNSAIDSIKKWSIKYAHGMCFTDGDDGGKDKDKDDVNSHLKGKCEKLYIKSINKPVIQPHRSYIYAVGTWLRDASDELFTKVYAIDKIGDLARPGSKDLRRASQVKVYDDLNTLETSGNPSSLINLPAGKWCQGTDHVILNNNLYCDHYNGSMLMKYDLSTGEAVIANPIPELKRTISHTFCDGRYRYLSFSTDENGLLWVIYPTGNKGNITVSLLDPDDLTNLGTWYTDYPIYVPFVGKVGNAFMANCVLYLTGFCKDSPTDIRYVYDTVTSKGFVLEENVIPLLQSNNVRGDHLDWASVWSLNYNPVDDSLYGNNYGKLERYKVSFEELESFEQAFGNLTQTSA